MEFTVYLVGYVPADESRPEDLNWPQGLTFSGRMCTAWYSGNGKSYDSLGECLRAHELRLQELIEWLLLEGRSPDAGILALRYAAEELASKSMRVVIFEADAARYEELDLSTGIWEFAALIEWRNARLEVSGRKAPQVGSVLDAVVLTPGEAVDRLASRGLLGV